MTRARFGLALLLLTFACSDKIKHVAVTEVLLRVHADADVRAAIHKLRVTVAVPKNDGWDVRVPLELDVPARDDFWPVDIPVTPRDASALPSQLELVVDALDDGDDVLVQARAITHFIAQDQRMLELTLARCGTHSLGSLCEDQLDCHGTACQSCDDGACGDTSVTNPDALPTIPSDSAPDDNSGEPDAGESGGQGGHGGKGGAAVGGGGSGGRGGAGGKAAAGGGGTTQAGAGGSAGTPSEVWSAPELLEASDIDVTGAGASRNIAGDLVVVWRQDTASGPYWARRYVDGKWDTQAVNFFGVIPDASRFDVSCGIDRNGVAQIMYSDGQPHTYWLRWQGEASLPAAAPPLVLGDQTYGYPVLLGVTESGTSAALWGGAPDSSTQSQALYANRFDASTGWGTPAMFGSTDAQLRGYGAGINANGDWVSLFRVGTGTGPNMIKSFVGHGSGVTTPTGFDVPDALVSSSFLVGVDDDGNALAFYLAGADLQHLRFHWSRLGASDSSWAGEMALTPEGTANGAVTLADKTVVLISMEGASSNGPLHLMAYRFDEGKGWSAGERVSDDFMSDDRDLLVTANASGAVIVTWSEDTASGDHALVYKRYSTSKGWGDKGTIASFSAASSLSAISLNADGRAIVVWMQDQPTGAGSDLKWSRTP